MEFLLKENEKDWRYTREKVFMEEQGFQNEFDELDKDSIHITGYSEGTLRCCARCYMDEQNNWHIGRIAVLKEYRKLHLGAELLTYCEQVGIENKGVVALLDAQCQAVGFYASAGYQVCGEEHLDEHVPHLLMKKRLRVI